MMRNYRVILSGECCLITYCFYTSLFARKAAATSEKKHQTHNNKNKQTKERKNYAQIGRASEQCYQIYTPTNSKNIC